MGCGQSIPQAGTAVPQQTKNAEPQQNKTAEDTAAAIQQNKTAEPQQNKAAAAQQDPAAAAQQDTSTILAELDAIVAEHAVVVFSKSWCHYCSELILLLQDQRVRDIKVIELDHRRDEKDFMEALKQRTAEPTVPQVFPQLCAVWCCGSVSCTAEGVDFVADVHQSFLYR